jgi:hypothetical protein
MIQLNLLYDKWFLGQALPNCINKTILDYIFTNFSNNMKSNIVSFDLHSKFGNSHNSWMSNVGIKTIPSNHISNIDTKDWVYAIEPWGHLMYSVNVQAIEDYRNIFELIPMDIITKINNNDGKLLINYSHEGWISEWSLKGFYLAAKNVGIKLENIILILNDYNLEEKLNKFKEKYDIEKYPKVINYSFYLTASSKHFYEKHKDNNLYTKHINAIKSYKFLCLNRRLDLHRVVLLSEILNDIKDESLVSFDKKLITNEIHNLFKNQPDIEIKFNNLPEKVIADREDIENTNGYQHDNEDLFLESYISIVTETSFYIDNDFISEKIWKPLYQFHPFIVVGRPHLLKYLRDIGFKTFDFLIDEMYDTIEDNDLRMAAIIKEIKKINNIPIHELDTIIKSNIDILKHNYDLLNTFGKQTQITEDYFIKNIKDDNYNYIDIYKELKLELPTKII